MSVIFILAALGITFGYTSSTYRGVSGNSDISKKSVKELIEEKNKYKAAMEKVREIEEVRNGFITKRNLIKDTDNAKLNKMIPDNIDSVRLIIDVNNIAATLGMSLRDITISDAPVAAPRKDNPASLSDSNPYSYVILSFSLTGTYSDLVSFLFNLERSLRLSDVTSLNIESATESQISTDTKVKTPKGDPKYKMKVSLKTYFLKSK